MTWRQLVLPLSLGTLLTVVGVAAAAGNTVIIHAGLPDRVDAIELKQHESATKADIAEVKQNNARIEGKVDTVINLLRGRK